MCWFVVILIAQHVQLGMWCDQLRESTVLKWLIWQKVYNADIPKDIMSGYGQRRTERILFKENSSFVLCGRSQSGKTSFIYELLKNVENVFENKNNRSIEILYCFSSWQPLFDKMLREVRNIHFHKRLLEEELLDRIVDPRRKHLIIVINCLHAKQRASKKLHGFDPRVTNV